MASILKRNNSYHIMVSCGYDLNGKQIRKTKNWLPPKGMSEAQIKKALNQIVVDFEREVLSGRILDGNINFKDFAERWLKDYGETQLAPKTYDRYKRMLDDRVYPSIGHIKLDSLQPHHLMDFYKKISSPGERKGVNCKLNEKAFEVFKDSKLTKNELAKRSKCCKDTVYQALKGGMISVASAEKILKCLKLKFKDGVILPEENTSLSGKTIRHYHRLISVILKTAVHWQVIFSNPAERVKPPKAENKEAKYLDEKQTAYLIECLKKEPIDKRTMIITFVYSGMRRGELCGLKWEDIDFENQMISINKALQYVPKKGIFLKKPKTKASIRTIKLSPEVFTLLEEYKVWQEKQEKEAGDRWQDTGFIFTGWNGAPLHPDTITAWFADFVDKYDLSKISIHSLRHTNITLMIAAGVPLRTVARRGGHAQASTTSNIYAHAIQSVDELAAGAIANILNPTSHLQLR